MGDETLKSNTDCVYFLASPLTCKKGIDCEYRHSESARLNPRDCWYWLNGNCQNPVCAFRHLPLEGLPETSVEEVSLPDQASVPVNKTNIPCYYYFNGFCNRGESCFFLHGSDDATPARFTKTASTDTSYPPVEASASTLDGKLLLQVKAPIKPLCEAVVVENIHVQPKVNIKKSASCELVKQNSSVQVSMAELQEKHMKLERPIPEEDAIDGGCLLCGEESSEEQSDGLVGSEGSPEEHADRHAQPEEWLESSPGFDVLVDDGAEDGGYDENEQEYMLVHERETSVRHHLLHYDYEDYKDSMPYDPTDYSEARLSYEQKMELYGAVGNERVPRYAERVSNRAMERIQDPMMFQRSPSRKFKHGNRNGVDLREHLKKRMRTDRLRESEYSTSHGLYHLNGRRHETCARQHVTGSMPSGRLASEIGKNMISSQPNDETFFQVQAPRRWLRRSHGRCVRPRMHEKDKRRQAGPKCMFSDNSRQISSWEAAAHLDFTSFSGPKSLTEIKEGKRKAMGSETGFGTTKHSKTSSKDFEDPKALREILQEKGKVDAVH
ncbi:hypothetical protein Scep_024159 [Stephania cephalantha]|uniref:C3H1-type domain-containing protein n=1 Tax=Stephania cephalantha TaxID=152367 RepID=A0AAP0EWP0_9MAGN